MSMKTLAMGAMLAVLALTAVAQRVVTLSGSRSGDREVVVSRSFGGVVLPWQKVVKFDGDTCVTYQFGKDALDTSLCLSMANLPRKRIEAFQYIHGMIQRSLRWTPYMDCERLPAAVWRKRPQ